MSKNMDQINELLAKLNLLSRKQEDFGREIADLREEIRILIKENRPAELKKTSVPIVSVSASGKEESDLVFAPKPPQEHKSDSGRSDSIKVKTNLEKLIGENLISKIGIIILILGVAIGSKYAIDHDLISPLTRIIMGYLVGLGLLGFAIRLKKKYDNFSAVLLSGAMAILYFITFAAYNFFSLIPETLTFALMVLFTIFTVVAALNYNKEVIAHIGLVGAYAVPFLLSDGSGKVLVLFAYMAIINIGILGIAFRKNWKILNYVAFGLTWIIYISWYLESYDVSTNFAVGITFLFVYFISFYLTFLAYKLIQKQRFELTDIVLLLSNSFIFYGLGYAILSNYQTGSQLLGLFTLGNALLHFIVSLVIFKQKLADRNLFYLISGLVLVFIAIAIPVQLDGNWVTLLWAGEAAVLFWIGRTKRVDVYEAISYGLMFLAFLSIFQDWVMASNYLNYQPVSTAIPFFNIQFLSSLLFIGAFVFIFLLNQNKKYPSVLIFQKEMLIRVSYIIPVAVLICIYMTFFNEIAAIFNQEFMRSEIKSPEGYDIHNYAIISVKTIWLINYSLLFTAVVGLVNVKWIKNRSLTNILPAISTVVVFIFLILGLYYLSELRDNYLRPTQPMYYPVTVFNIIFRYISYFFIALTVWSTGLSLKKNDFTILSANKLLIMLHVTILWILTSEMINWLDIAGHTESYKLGVTILWGVYSLAMIALGIWKKNKNLRITAIVLFGLTLVKLFLYDIASLNTIAKTIVLVSLGILLLIISFLYNRYKHFIFDGNEN